MTAELSRDRDAGDAPLHRTSIPTYDVVVSIISMGNIKQLSDCLQALRHAANGIRWLCRIVDNSPTPGTVDQVAAVYGAQTIRVEGKRGFSTNHNTVLRPLTQSGESRYALVLNDDVLLDPGSLTSLIAHMEANDATGIVAPQLLNVDRSPAPSKMAFPTLYGEVARWFSQHQLRDIAAPGWIVGACMLVRVSALGEIDCFDERFFLFYEDVDICKRMTESGFSCDLVPDATGVHVGHQSVGPPRMGSLSSREYRRGRWQYFRKHRQPVAGLILNGVAWCAVPFRRFSSASRAETKAARTSRLI